jgi:hypothetical protein
MRMPAGSPAVDQTPLPARPDSARAQNVGPPSGDDHPPTTTTSPVATAPTADTAQTAPPTAPPERHSPLEWILSVGSPLAVTGALLYYFGWVRTTIQSRYLGFDASVLGLSTTDFVLKSVNVLFVPAVLLAVLAVAARHGDQLLIRRVASRPRTRQRVLRILTVTRWSWLAFAGLAVAMLLVPAVRSYALPTCLTGALLVALYTDRLMARWSRAEVMSQATRVFLVVLLALGVFWFTERLARTIGEGYARQILNHPEELPAVIVYSTKDLRLDAPGVRSEALGPGEGFRYRYVGLRLMQASQERYVLLSVDPFHGLHRVVVLPYSADVRTEFGS